MRGGRGGGGGRGLGRVRGAPAAWGRGGAPGGGAFPPPCVPACSSHSTRPRRRARVLACTLSAGACVSWAVRSYAPVSQATARRSLCACHPFETMSIRILIADDEQAARFGMARALAQEKPILLQSTDVRTTIEAIRDGLPDLVFLDLTMPDGDGRAALRELAGSGPACEIVVVTAHDDVQTAVECLQLGAADYITKPYEIERVRGIARRCASRLELEQRARELHDQVEHRRAPRAAGGGGPPMEGPFPPAEGVAPPPVGGRLPRATRPAKRPDARRL